MTTLSDIVIPENFSKYTVEKAIELNLLWQSGVIATNSIIQSLASSGGQTVTVPMWKSLDTTESNISNDDVSDEAVPLVPTAFKSVARISQLNQSWEASDLASEIAGSDPIEMVRSKLHEYWATQLNYRLISTVAGMVADSVANHDSDLVYSDLAAADGGLFCAKGFIKACQTLGDAKSGLKAMLVHSAVQAKMSEDDVIVYVQDSLGNINIPTYKGLRLIVSDECKVQADASGDIYSSYLVGTDVFGAAFGTAKVPAEIDRKPLAGHGGGFETLVSRTTCLLHPQGYVFTDASVAGNSPTKAELEIASNWVRTLTNRKSINMVVYKSRAEYVA